MSYIVTKLYFALALMLSWSALKNLFLQIFSRMQTGSLGCGILYSFLAIILIFYTINLEEKRIKEKDS